MKKILIVLAIVMVIVIGLSVYWQKSTTWSSSDYQDCADAGGSTQESDPPTCFHPNGYIITPGSPKK